MRKFGAMLAIAIVANGGSVTSAGQHCLQYEPIVVELQGVVVVKTFYGLPNFGENPETDARVKHALLKVDKSICVTGGPSSDVNDESEQDQTLVTLRSFGKIDLIAYDGKHVLVRGSLYHAQTAHERTPIVMSVTQVTAQ